MKWVTFATFALDLKSSEIKKILLIKFKNAEKNKGHLKPFVGGKGENVSKCNNNFMKMLNI